MRRVRVPRARLPLAVLLVLVLLLTASCLRRMNLTLTPSEFREREQCRATWAGLLPSQSHAGERCVEKVWSFLRLAESGGTCSRDDECIDVFVGGRSGGEGPQFVAVNAAWTD